MTAEEIEGSFPLLSSVNYEVTSDRHFNYNCLAFARGDRNNWWERPGRFGFYRPAGFAADVTVKTAVKIIRIHGFTMDWNSNAEPLSDSIAIHAKDQNWTHFAKYSGGRRLSKLGEDHDIAHKSLAVLEGDLHRKAVRVLSRIPN